MADDVNEIWLSEATITTDQPGFAKNTDCLVLDLDRGNWTHLANTPADSVCVWTGGADNHEFFIGTSGGTGFIYQQTLVAGTDDTQEAGVDLNINAYVTTGKVPPGHVTGLNELEWFIGEVNYSTAAVGVGRLDYFIDLGTVQTGPSFSTKDFWTKNRWPQNTASVTTDRRGVRWTFKATFPGSSLIPQDLELVGFAVGYRELQTPTDNNSF